jgi:hypothetical protein
VHERYTGGTAARARGRISNKKRRELRSCIFLLRRSLCKQERPTKFYVGLSVASLLKSFPQPEKAERGRLTAQRLRRAASPR